MKIGIRKPNLKKRVKARTTARVKRSLKSSVNPLYGKKGMGWVNDPKKAAYDKIYNKTTISVDDCLKSNNKEVPQGDAPKWIMALVALPFILFIVLFLSLVIGFIVMFL